MNWYRISHRCYRTILFPDSQQYFVCSKILHLINKKKVYIFQSGIPSQIWKEMLLTVIDCQYQRICQTEQTDLPRHFIQENFEMQQISQCQNSLQYSQLQLVQLLTLKMIPPLVGQIRFIKIIQILSLLCMRTKNIQDMITWHPEVRRSKQVKVLEKVKRQLRLE